MHDARKTYINQTIRKVTFVGYVDFDNNMKYFTYFAKNAFLEIIRQRNNIKKHVRKLTFYR
jgi:hypothetical protein